jgi:hypothetical protein
VGKPIRCITVILFCILAFSCIGAQADITLRNNGSGTLKLEYRIAGELESLGKFDGNEHWLPLPAGRADLERSIDRIPGLKLVSFDSKEDGKDLVLTTRLEFADGNALAGFLDSTGQDARVDFAQKRIVLHFPAAEEENLEFREFFTEAFSGYNYALSFTLPGPARGRWLDGAPDSGQLNTTEHTVSFAVPMADLVFQQSPADLEISWQ